MTDDSTPRVPLGPIGRNLIRNLVSLREGQKLTYRELSERLEQIGRPIPTLGLSRIEKGTRRVDVDDLVALAVALDVSPMTLLLPPDGDEAELSAGLCVPAETASRWMAGLEQLPPAAVITWPRRLLVIGESVLAELRQRIEDLESAARLSFPNKQKHGD